ncbi:hypothetical protein BU23DRAFT_217812 [Bimuria novae-zelandiae CBS 107.79]|uniref:Uncharacterized protein n=1 Tax=Bimuria novae-zelandiae CBS 107.79 TaxID=1447943 RepID=A0A6A5V2G8_9PLEO|nr:hypothetical protein BU23DRAFT_217812 [Bimuria novae-zelandiae CBS 107.79]
MSTMLERVRDYAQGHPISVAAGLIIALPGTYLFVTGNNQMTQFLMNHPTDGPSIYETTPVAQNFQHLISKWSDRPTPPFVVQVLRVTHNNAIILLTAIGERLGVDVRQLLRTLENRWAPHFPVARMISLATSTALPGVFLVFIRNHPNSWPARHQTKIGNALQILALVTVANQTISIQDLLVAAFVVVSFEALQQVACESATSLAVRNISSTAHAVVARSDTFSLSRPGPLTRKHSSSNPEPTSMASGTKDAEIDRLHIRLAELKAAEKSREVDLKRTKAELHNARTTLNETFTEYASLRDELKTIKQTLGRDHQAAVYRKDIELFALRKANEQKENHIKDREAKLEDSQRQHKATLELRDSELRNVKERVMFLERQSSPMFENDGKVDSATESDSQAALQVKFLRVKGRNSIKIDEQTLAEKDNEIAKLKAELADAKALGEYLNSTQSELRRAWHATSEMQRELNDERQQHAQTQEKLCEAALRIEELTKGAQRNLPGRLPTIDEQDKQELEAMFNTAQQDNSRLYGEVEALEKRVREANARVFMSEQAAEALREQLRLEKAINDDMEMTRPSLVHRVHYQRMEGQLQESRDELEAKEVEMKKLEKTAAEKDAKIEELSKAQESSSSAHVELEQENERLKGNVKELESTKEQLMLDHERLARNCVRNRTTSAEHTSARSSGATLITEPVNLALPIPPNPPKEETPLPARPVSIVPDTPSSIQGTPERHLRRDLPNRLTMISNDVPPAELRHSRRKSLTLKGLMRKITRKDDEDEKIEKEDRKAGESPRPKTALMPKDKNTLTRPKTAAPREKSNEAKEKDGERPKTAAAPAEDSRRPDHRRYYSESRPKTSAAEEGKGTGTENGQRPKSRGWAASRKLVRKSIV